MATGDLKSDLINGAYSHMRISGITVQPSAEDNKVALTTLEELAASLKVFNVCAGYNFEDDPDINSSSGISKGLRGPFKWVLAEHLLSEFGKGAQDKVDINLFKKSAAGLSLLYASTANPRQTQYPDRQAIGSGNTLRHQRFRRFYRPAPVVPNDCDSNIMEVNDVNDYVEHFDSYLIDGEVIDTYTLEEDTGLTIQAQSNDTPDINYRVKAVGNNGTKADSLLQVRIIVTTDTGRVETRTINFQINPETVIT